MSSTRSTNNFSLVPLGPNKAFIGQYDDALKYSSATILVSTDTDCELIIYQSIDKIRTISSAFQTLAGVPFIKIFPLTCQYTYCTLRNTNSSNTQTYMNFDVIYRETNSAGVSEIVSTKVWDAAAVNVNSLSGDVMLVTKMLSVFGTVEASFVCTLTVQYSVDGVTFYNSQYSYNVLAGGDFGFTIGALAPYARLKITSVPSMQADFHITAYMSIQ